MKPKWLVEADIFEDNSDKLVEIVKRKGMDIKILKYIPFDEDLVSRVSEMYDEGDCVIFYGSLNFGRKLKQTTFVPGVYLNEKAFECTSYYPVLNALLLHHYDYMMLPYGDLVNFKERLFKHFGDKIFIRPNSGFKEFTGMIVEKDKFEDCIELAGFYDVEPNLLVLISSVENILKEWRFVIVDGKVISGSLYRDWSAPAKHAKSSPTRDYVLSHSHSLWEGCKDDIAWKTAQKAADIYNPDRCWTIDVAMNEIGLYSVLEIGCFSCAGLYGNDLDKVVDAVSEAAIKEWGEYNE